MSTAPKIIHAVGHQHGVKNPKTDSTIRIRIRHVHRGPDERRRRSQNFLAKHEIDRRPGVKVAVTQPAPPQKHVEDSLVKAESRDFKTLRVPVLVDEVGQEPECGDCGTGEQVPSVDVLLRAQLRLPQMLFDKEMVCPRLQIRVKATRMQRFPKEHRVGIHDESFQVPAQHRGKQPLLEVPHIHLALACKPLNRTDTSCGHRLMRLCIQRDHHKPASQVWCVALCRNPQVDAQRDELLAPSNPAEHDLLPLPAHGLEPRTGCFVRHPHRWRQDHTTLAL
mmetsp:Transcript_13294/g.33210  ORF Transcript_13294/g.33210 Transcript_13294/m.33210 type:complete len:279 (-) Transcript_13294:666-1502(-)